MQLDDKEAAILISALRHWECGLSGPCHGDCGNETQASWCTRAGKWLELYEVTAKDIRE